MMALAEFEAVQPTRLELLRMKRRKTIAQSVVEHLKKELLTLTLRLYELAKKRKVEQTLLNESLRKAYGLFVQAEMISGQRSIEEASLTSKVINFNVLKGVERDEKLGLSFLSFTFLKDALEHELPRYGITDTSASLDESSVEIQKSLNKIVQIAELESSIIVLLNAISIRRRRLNRIQNRVLPQIDNTIKRIEFVIDEIERQDAVRVRVLQRKRKERAQSTVKE